MKLGGHIYQSTSGKFFFPQPHSFPPSSHPSFWQDSGNIVPEKQPPSADAVKNFHVLNCLLQINLKNTKSDLTAALNRQNRPWCLKISLRTRFKWTEWNCDLVPQRAEMGIQQWPFIIGMREAAVGNSPFCSQLNSWAAPHMEGSILGGNRI